MLNPICHGVSLKSYWQNKKGDQYFIRNKPNQPCHPVHMVGKILKIPLVRLVPKSVILCLSCLTSNLLNCFFSKFLILSRGLPRWWSPSKIAASWRYRVPIKNLTPHYSQFCVSFDFCIDQEARRRL